MIEAKAVPKGLERVASYFKIIYGREPVAEALPALDHVAGSDPMSGAQAFHSIIRAIDQQSLRAPFLIRFSDRDVRFVTVKEIEVATDAADRAISAQVLASLPLIRIIHTFDLADQQCTRPGSCLRRDG